MADKIDPYKIKERYLCWKEKALKNGIKGLSKENSQIILQYLHDMEQGINVSVLNKKGGRSYLRLNSLSIKIAFLARKLQELFELNLIQIKEVHLFSFFADMRNGSIQKLNGGIYKNTGDYVKDVKSFWHWHMKVNRKRGIEINDITMDLDTSKEKPDWVYLTEEEVKQLCANAEYKYEVLIWFLFDSGIRAPTELVNVKVSDFFNDFKELNIREETSKTFGRRIKLMLSSNIIKEYVKIKGLKSEDYIFPINPSSTNRTLKRLGKKVLGDKKSPAGQKYSEITMYDFRHNSCCYWLPRYKSESALKYRFGWKKSEKIHYYSELLGMKDTIAEDDMYVDITKTELEKKLERSDKDKAILQERVQNLELQMVQIMNLVKELKLNYNDLNIQPSLLL